MTLGSGSILYLLHSINSLYYKQIDRVCAIYYSLNLSIDKFICVTRRNPLTNPDDTFGNPYDTQTHRPNQIRKPRFCWVHRFLLTENGHFQYLSEKDLIIARAVRMSHAAKVRLPRPAQRKVCPFKHLFVFPVFFIEPSVLVPLKVIVK